LPTTAATANSYPRKSDRQPGIGYIADPLDVVVRLDELLRCDIPLNLPVDQPGFVFPYRKWLEALPSFGGSTNDGKNISTFGSLISTLVGCEAVTSLPIPAYHGGYDQFNRPRPFGKQMSAALFIPYCFARVTDGSRWWTARPLRVDEKRNVFDGHDLFIHMFPDGVMDSPRSELYYSESRRNDQRLQTERFLGELLTKKVPTDSAHKKLVTASYALDETRICEELLFAA